MMYPWEGWHGDLLDPKLVKTFCSVDTNCDQCRLEGGADPQRHTTHLCAEFRSVQRLVKCLNWNKIGIVTRFSNGTKWDVLLTYEVSGTYSDCFWQLRTISQTNKMKLNRHKGKVLQWTLKNPWRIRGWETPESLAIQRKLFSGFNVMKIATLANKQNCQKS